MGHTGVIILRKAFKNRLKADPQVRWLRAALRWKGEPNKAETGYHPQDVVDFI